MSIKSTPESLKTKFPYRLPNELMSSVDDLIELAYVSGFNKIRFSTMVNEKFDVKWGIGLDFYVHVDVLNLFQVNMFYEAFNKFKKTYGSTRGNFTINLINHEPVKVTVDILDDMIDNIIGHKFNDIAKDRIKKTVKSYLGKDYKVWETTKVPVKPVQPVQPDVKITFPVPKSYFISEKVDSTLDKFIAHRDDKEAVKEIIKESLKKSVDPVVPEDDIVVVDS